MSKIAHESSNRKRNPDSILRWAAHGVVQVAWPTLLAFAVLAADLTIAWNPGSEPDISAYGIYLRKGSNGPPYELWGYIGQQEIDPAHPAFEITDLEDWATYYVVITAIDAQGLESDFSNSACARLWFIAWPCKGSGGFPKLPKAAPGDEES
jgi:hypothetical protein